MNIGLIFAGGVGSRMHSKNGTPKQFLEVYGKPIIIYTLEKFEYDKNIDAIVVSCIEEYVDYCCKLVEKYNLKKVRKIVKGGRNGQESIYNGLKAAESIVDKNSIVLIHDGVRPIITEEVIDNNINNVKCYGSSITCAYTKETIAQIDSNNEICTITNRNKTVIAKAPQCFYLQDIIEIHEQALKDGNINTTDSSSLMKMYNKKLHVYIGSNDNIKITTPDDYYLFKALLDAQENSKVFS